ncbi:hypothetical protein GCM10011357_24280 [Lacimicrobium alkaliphilum]|uniref:Uncharacterized protein n=1 Tax=Lacimicrobium alkaliphilum TaxID=1526571 RepID=A0ABQ1RIT1_9ALTE|nr:hypothetical protein GCM10011357_24280 [Lacimicrobium alkaliphilum]
MKQCSQIKNTLQYIPRQQEERRQSVVSPHWPKALVQPPYNNTQTFDETGLRSTPQS